MSMTDNTSPFHSNKRISLFVDWN